MSTTPPPPRDPAEIGARPFFPVQTWKNGGAGVRHGAGVTYMHSTAKKSWSWLSWLMLGLLGWATACADPESEDIDLDDAEALEPGGPLGKDDSVGMPGLPLNGNYAASMVWEVDNQWEDTDTPAARQAGLAWPADSGLTWDQKYAAWVQSLQKIPGNTISETFELTTPFGKTLPAPKLDCADAALMMRASFAAWYRLPFYVVAFDGGEPVYFGHFGIRTANGIWNNMPAFANHYADHTDMDPAQYMSNWPQDSVLRKRGVQSGDDQPFLGDNARTGTYLDEIHLNKRAGHFIRLLLIFTGSMNLADSRNTFNLDPEAIEAGDVMLWRWQALGVGHTMMTMRSVDIGEGRKEVQSAFGNLPPNQPKWEGPIATKLAYVNQQGGGHDGSTDYAPFNGGLKRFRVAKPMNGRWTNTFMASDEASWINDRDHDAMHERPGQIEALLGEVDPADLRDALVDIIESKREHLRSFPASCSARIKREEAFDDLYALMSEHFGTSADEVDRQFRTFEDYVFAELEYDQSKTCCWNSSTAAMYDTVMSLNEQLQAEAGDACMQPVVFKAVDGDYAVFRDHNPVGWVPWSADEACPQAGVLNDAEAEHDAMPFCEWSEAGGDEPEPPAPDAGASCEGRCGTSSSDGSCWCDDQCAELGDCCADLEMVCG